MSGIIVRGQLGRRQLERVVLRPVRGEQPLELGLVHEARKIGFDEHEAGDAGSLAATSTATKPP
jgi:hypothetical protein